MSEPEAMRIARDHIDKADRNIHPDRCAACTMARYIVEQHEPEAAKDATIAELRAERAQDRIFGERCVTCSVDLTDPDAEAIEVRLLRAENAELRAQLAGTGEGHAVIWIKCDGLRIENADLRTALGEAVDAKEPEVATKACATCGRRLDFGDRQIADGICWPCRRDKAVSGWASMRVSEYGKTEQHDAREAARASMPGDVQPHTTTVLRAALEYVARREANPDRAPDGAEHAYTFAKRLIAAHEREVAKDAEIAELRKALGGLIKRVDWMLPDAKLPLVEERKLAEGMHE